MSDAITARPARASQPAVLSRRAFTAAGAALSAGLLWGGGSAFKVLTEPIPALGDEAVEDSLTLAVVDFQPTWGDVEANVAQMEDFVAQAAEAGVNLLLFPEMCVTGYVSSDDETDDDSRMCIEAAEGTDGEVAAKFSQLAQDTGMWIVYGNTEPIEGDDAHAYNAAFVCSPAGGVATYRKIHPVEGAWCTPGDTPLILDTAWGKVGVDICYDTYAIPELERYYAAQGCRLLLNPTATSRGFNSETGETELWQWYFDSRVKNIATRDQIFVASANLAAYDGSHYTFPGGSCAWGPTGSDGSDVFAERVVGDAASAEPASAMYTGTVDLSLATATDILASDNYKPELFAEWYAELAEMDEDGADLVAAPTQDCATVCTVNFQPAFGDKAANLESMKGYIEEAAAAGANILVFPEMALTGYAWAAEDDTDAANGKTVVEIAEPLDGEYVAQIAELAKANEMYIVFGTAEPVDGDDEHAYNSAFVCDTEGGIQAYRKIAPVEGPWCTAGTEPLIVETPYGAMGISICKDTYAYPELARYYTAKGCVYLINPTARTGVADGWADLYENALENLADQDKMIVVSADLCGADLSAPEEQAAWDPYTGASVVSAPLSKGADGAYVQTWGSYESDPEACGLITAEIDYADLWLGQGSAIYCFNPSLYEALYEDVAAGTCEVAQAI